MLPSVRSFATYPPHTTLRATVVTVLPEIFGPIRSAKLQAHEDHRVHHYPANLPSTPMPQDDNVEDAGQWKATGRPSVRSQESHGASGIQPPKSARH